MKTLPKPCDDNGTPLDVADIFEQCQRTIRSATRRAAMLAIKPQLSQTAVDYNQKASTAQLHLFPRQNVLGTVSQVELNNLYTQKLVPKEGPGRAYYEKIMGTPYQLCPLCGIGTVNTLDHHLPKAKYPALSITPSNLVPACQWCQDPKQKGEKFPTRKEEQTFHPYFDYFDSDIWLQAEVIETTPASFRYFVVQPPGWSNLSVERLKYHMDVFKLATLYARNAGRELVGLRGMLKRLLDVGGGEAVRIHMSDCADSWGQNEKNSWKDAMYRAAAASVWFCDGGFYHT